MSSQEEQIKNISRAKATLKSKLTRFNNFLNNEVVPNLNSNLPLAEVEVLDVQSRLDRVQPFLLNEFEELQTKLSLLFNDEEYDRKLKELNIESEIFESSYFSSVVLAKKIINVGISCIQGCLAAARNPFPLRQPRTDADRLDVGERPRDSVRRQC